MKLAYRQSQAPVLWPRNFINTILSSSPSGKEVNQYKVAITQHYLYKLQRVKFKHMGASDTQCRYISMMNYACENKQIISYKMNPVEKHDPGEARINKVVISNRMTIKQTSTS